MTKLIVAFRNFANKLNRRLRKTSRSKTDEVNGFGLQDRVAILKGTRLFSNDILWNISMVRGCARKLDASNPLPFLIYTHAPRIFCRDAQTRSFETHIFSLVTVNIYDYKKCSVCVSYSLRLETAFKSAFESGKKNGIIKNRDFCPEILNNRQSNTKE
jgi:hypothetical protein